MAVGKAWLSRSTSRCTTWSTEDHGTPHSADSRSAVLPHAEQLTFQRWREKWSALSRTHIIFHTQHLSLATLSHTYNYIHTYVPSYIHTYIHTYLPTYIHTTIHTYLPFYLPDLSPPPFVFPSFPVPAKTIEAHFRKKLTCGVIRSFNFVFPITTIMKLTVLWMGVSTMSSFHLAWT